MSESIITIKGPDEERAQQMVMPLVKQAAGIVSIESPEHHAAGLTLIRELRGMKREVQAVFRDAKSAANKAHKAVVAAERKQTEPLDKADAYLNELCNAYEQRAKQEEERLRREAEAAARKADDERRLREAIEAEERGDERGVDIALSEPVVDPAPIVERQTAKVEGVSSSLRWHAVIDDKLALVRFVAANPAWLHLLDVNMKSLNQMAVAQREAFSLPGVAAQSKTIRTVRS